MKLTEQDIDQIDAHLAGKLSGEELVAFELRKVNDTEFGNEVEMMEALRAGVVRSVLEDKMRMLQAFDGEDRREGSGERGEGREGVSEEHAATTVDSGSLESKGKVRGLWKVLAVAASILFIGAFGILQLNKGGVSIEPFPDLMTVRSVEKDQLNQAMLAYSNKKYNTALKLFNEINDNELNQDISFYKSISSLMIGQLNDAEKFLSQSNGSKYPISFYQGMIDLKRGNKIANLPEFCACKNCPPFLLLEIKQFCTK